MSNFAIGESAKNYFYKKNQNNTRAKQSRRKKILQNEGVFEGKFGKRVIQGRKGKGFLDALSTSRDKFDCLRRRKDR